MKGNNELRLCAAEMMVAVQEYLNKRMTVYAPTVDAVSCAAGLAQTFVITLKEKETNDA